MQNNTLAAPPPPPPPPPADAALDAVFASRAPRWPQPHFHAFRRPQLVVSAESGTDAAGGGADACALRLRRVPPYLAHFVADHLCAQPEIRAATVHADSSDPVEAGVYSQVRVFSRGPAAAAVPLALRRALAAAADEIEALWRG